MRIWHLLVKYLPLVIGDCIRAGIFVSAVAAVYLFTLVWWLAWWKRKRNPAEPGKNWRARLAQNRYVGVTLSAVALLGLGCMIYAVTIGPNRLTVTRYTIQSTKIPKGTQIRIVQLADLHVRKYGPREKQLPQLVRDLNPDLIVNTGDLWGARDGCEAIVSNMLKSWNVPQFFSYGNMDFLGDCKRVSAETGMRILDDATREITIRGVRFNISGYSMHLESRIKKELLKVPKDTFNILLYHHPSGFPATWDTNTDVMFAGHIHGGQIRLPWYGAIVTLDKAGKRWEYGHYFEHGVHLIVSRGIGCELFVAEIRFLCPPEVVVVDLIGAGPERNP